MIGSRYNATFKDLKSLNEPKGAKKLGSVLVSGRKIVPELYENALSIVAEEGNWPDDLPQTKKIIWLDRTLFKDVDIFGTHYPLLVYPIPDLAPWTPGPPKGLEIVLSLQDPANLGAVLRSAEAFGVDRVVLLKECAFPFHPKAIRSSSGSCFRVPIFSGPSQKDFSDDNTIGLDASGEPLCKFAWPKDVRILIGEEGQGLPAPFPGTKISIPIKPSLDSLNATIAASVALFAYRQNYEF